jgi:hypothetical protein
MSDAGSGSGSGSGSESESDCPAQPLFRPNGFWYNKAYEVLPKFACRLTATHAAQVLPVPRDVCDAIGRFTHENDVHGAKRLEVAQKTSAYILSTLQQRMGGLYSADPYMNVINYFKARKGDDFLKRLSQAKDEYLLKEILPWLGLTDWGCSTGGRTIQMATFKSKLKQFLKQRFPRPKRSASALPASDLEASALAASALESPALESSALPASALPASALPASVLPASANVQLTPEELRYARGLYFGFKKKEGGKRLNSRKLRKRKSKRTCKRRHTKA